MGELSKALCVLKRFINTSPFTNTLALKTLKKNNPEKQTKKKKHVMVVSTFIFYIENG